MKPIIAVPATLALVYRAYSRKSLTPLGIFVAALTAVAHAIHPWSIFFTLLCVFFLAGTAVTKVKHNVKARLTQSASGASGGEGARTHVQVLANSLVASVLTLLHAWVLSKHSSTSSHDSCWHRPSTQRAADVLVVGIVANYAAVAADTFSSELGILASSPPRLITAPWRQVARGTNGGVTLTGITAGLAGSAVIAAVAGVAIPFCTAAADTASDIKQRAGLLTRNSGWALQDRLLFVLALTAVGIGGSLLDSLLGAVVQASVVDVRTGKVVEGNGGRKVMVRRANWLNGEAADVGKASGTEPADGSIRRKAGSEVAGEKSPEQKHESRRVETGWDLLDNNGVNFAMALTMSLLAMLGACIVWDIPPQAVLKSIIA